MTTKEKTDAKSLIDQSRNFVIISEVATTKKGIECNNILGIQIYLPNCDRALLINLLNAINDLENLIVERIADKYLGIKLKTRKRNILR